MVLGKKTGFAQFLYSITIFLHELVLIGIENTIARQNDHSKIVEVFLHTEENQKLAGKNTTSVPRSRSTQFLTSTLSKVARDKKNKTTNVPSNCSTAIMMPLNSLKTNSQQCELFGVASLEKNVLHDNRSTEIRLHNTDTIVVNNRKDCDGYDTYTYITC